MQPYRIYYWNSGDVLKNQVLIYGNSFTDALNQAILIVGTWDHYWITKA